MAGKFIVFEGIDGSGKTTQVELLTAYLSTQGIKWISTREPGGTVGAEEIRNLLVKKHSYNWSPATEIMLFTAARSDLVEKIIKPYLEQDYWVICDRFVFSTLTYQCYGNKPNDLDYFTLILQAHNYCTNYFYPDLTFVLDVPVDVGLTRAKQGHYETLDKTFHERVRIGYKELWDWFPILKFIDANQSKELVHEAIIASLRKKWAEDLNVTRQVV